MKARLLLSPLGEDRLSGDLAGVPWSAGRRTSKPIVLIVRADNGRPT